MAAVIARLALIEAQTHKMDSPVPIWAWRVSNHGRHIGHGGHGSRPLRGIPRQSAVHKVKYWQHNDNQDDPNDTGVQESEAGGQLSRVQLLW